VGRWVTVKKDGDARGRHVWIDDEGAMRTGPDGKVIDDGDEKEKYIEQFIKETDLEMIEKHGEKTIREWAVQSYEYDKKTKQRNIDWKRGIRKRIKKDWAEGKSFAPKDFEVGDQLTEMPPPNTFAGTVGTITKITPHYVTIKSAVDGDLIRKHKDKMGRGVVGRPNTKKYYFFNFEARDVMPMEFMEFEGRKYRKEIMRTK
jgi:hypothetical protein